MCLDPMTMNLPISSSMDAALSALKQAQYSGTTTDAMLADLIRIGLAAAASQNKSDSASQNPQS